MTEWQFEWFWCDQCDCAAVKCPKCDNNTCNATYGPAEGTIHDNYDANGPKCPICPLAHQFSQLGWSFAAHPTKEQLKAK